MPDIKDTLYTNCGLAASEKDRVPLFPTSMAVFFCFKNHIRKDERQIKESYLSCEIFDNIFISNINRGSQDKRYFKGFLKGASFFVSLYILLE